MSRVRGGFIPSEYDGRDVLLSRNSETHSSVQLYRPGIRDQGTQVDCCTSMAIATAFEIVDHFDGRSSRLSALYHYYFARRDPRHLGAITLRGALKAAVNSGFCLQSLHDLTIDPEGALKKPSEEAINDASNRRLEAYDPITGSAGYYTLDGRRRIERWKQVLSDGFPIIVGVWTQSSYWEGRGIMANLLESNQGAHAACVVGFDETSQTFSVRDSRGLSFADQGEWKLSYDVVNSRSVIESWTIQKLTFND